MPLSSPSKLWASEGTSDPAAVKALNNWQFLPKPELVDNTSKKKLRIAIPTGSGALKRNGSSLCCWETFYMFACGSVGNPHLTAKIHIVAPLPTSTKYGLVGSGIFLGLQKRPHSSCQFHQLITSRTLKLPMG